MKNYLNLISKEMLNKVLFNRDKVDYIIKKKNNKSTSIYYQELNLNEESYIHLHEFLHKCKEYILSRKGTYKEHNTFDIIEEKIFYSCEFEISDKFCGNYQGLSEGYDYIEVQLKLYNDLFHNKFIN